MRNTRPFAGRLWTGGVIVVAGAFALSACGGSTESSSDAGSSDAGSSSSQASTSSATPITGEPIVIGAIGSQTGPLASSLNQGFTVASAWADWVNANGGINGRPVQVETGDDALDPAKAQAAAKDLIDNKDVDVLVVVSDTQFTAYAEYAVSKGIPVISGESNSPLWYELGGLYTTSTDVASTLKAIVSVAKEYADAKKFAWTYCLEVAACTEFTPVMEAAAGDAGMGFTSLGISSTAPDYTAECLKLQQEDADFVFVGASEDGVAKFAQDCQAQGYNPTYGVTSNLVGDAVLAVGDFTGYGPSYSFPSGADAPAVQTFTDAMEEFAKDDSWPNGTGSATWTALEMLRRAMGSVGDDEVTPASVTAALNTVKDEDLDGLLANKVTYTGEPLVSGSRPCYFVIAVKEGEKEAPADLEPQCPA